MSEIRSIMAGTVLMIHVQKGEEISIGQEVIIIESMKMAIPIESDVSGKVAEVKAKVGDFVNEDDTLLVLE